MSRIFSAENITIPNSTAYYAATVSKSVTLASRRRLLAATTDVVICGYTIETNSVAGKQLSWDMNQIGNSTEYTNSFLSLLNSNGLPAYQATSKDQSQLIPPPPGDGLSTGALVGIIVGSIVGGILLLALACVLFRKCRKGSEEEVTTVVKPPVKTKSTRVAKPIEPVEVDVIPNEPKPRRSS